MHIKRAKNEIKNALRAYLARDEFGAYRIPPIRQRPILLMGPPGIGKTQIMEQIAEETGVGLVSYTLTHHTRQSALGLPYIEHQKFGGQEYAVTAYTMSEIIASVYREIERTGVKEGILFLDEINCISETLTPMMLQFLQCKTFGNQRLPEGWVVVAAGNPPEYNKSVREFDVVTLDRVKRIDVEEDYGVWKEYAYRRGVHGAILSYLEARRDHFYRVEATADGMQFVTARGWEDLSELMQVYEGLGLPVDRRSSSSICSCRAWRAILQITSSCMRNTSASTAWKRFWTAAGRTCALPSWRARRLTKSWACSACCCRGWAEGARETYRLDLLTDALHQDLLRVREGRKDARRAARGKAGRARAPPRRRSTDRDALFAAGREVERLAAFRQGLALEKTPKGRGFEHLKDAVPAGRAGARGRSGADRPAAGKRLCLSRRRHAGQPGACAVRDRADRELFHLVVHPELRLRRLLRPQPEAAV